MKKKYLCPKTRIHKVIQTCILAGSNWEAGAKKHMSSEFNDVPSEDSNDNGWKYNGWK